MTTNLGPGDHAILVLEQPAHEADLARGQRAALIAAHDDHARQIDRHAIDHDFIERFGGRRAPPERPHPGQQLAR